MRRESLFVLNAIWRRLACAKDDIRPQQDVATVAKIENKTTATAFSV